MDPIHPAPGTNARSDISNQTENSSRKQQPQIERVSEQESERCPRQQGLVRRRDIENLPQHDDVEDKAGKCHHRGKLGEVSAAIPVLNPGRADERRQCGGNQDADLHHRRKPAPEPIEQKEHTCRQR